MAIDRETVRHVAMLSRLVVTEEELDRFTEQLSAILDYIGKLNQLDTSAVAPMSHALALRDVLRADEPSPPLSREQALGNAPEEAAGFFRVPPIIE